MKTNRLARGIPKMRILLLFLAVIGLAALGLTLGDLMKTRAGKLGTSQPTNSHAPKGSLQDLMTSGSH